MTRPSTHVVRHLGHVDRAARETLLRQRGCTVWLTGLPSCGKSTIAFALEKLLIERSRLAYVLDGDNVRHGLNRDLGFSAADRTENIRRISEVACLFADAGLIVIASFVSPYRADRDAARRLHDEGGLPFIEAFVDTPVDVCEQRDPKGLYRRARSGAIPNFTGVSDPYEPPLKPDVVLPTLSLTVEACVARLLEVLTDRQVLDSK